MGFNIEYSDEAVLQLEKLDKTVVKRMMKKLDSLQENPKLFSKRLKGRLEYKVRVGDYRIIVGIDERKQIVFVHTLGHRKDIYEKS